MAPAGQISSQPLHMATHAFWFFTTVFFSPSFSSNPKALMWQKSTHFPQLTHAWIPWYLVSWNSFVCFFRHSYRPFFSEVEGRGRDLNPGKRLHRPIGYQATSPRPHFHAFPWLGNTYGCCCFVCTILVIHLYFRFRMTPLTTVKGSRPTSSSLTAPLIELIALIMNFISWVLKICQQASLSALNLQNCVSGWTYREKENFKG